eukprot:m.42358 g.42358  ORF g.42358 m.42358 type:complete len:388 (+) comp15023_c0_seq3:316-1479(+)
MASAPVTTTTTTTSTSADGAIRVVTTTTTASSVSTPKTTSPVQEKLHGEVITSGFHFSEGPRFHNGKLYIADMLGFDPESSHTSTTDGVLGDSGFIWEIDVETGNKRRYAAFCDTSPSGLGWLPDGRMIAVATSGGQVRVETKAGSGVFEPYADITPCFTAKTDLLNDMCVSPTGVAYVDVEFDYRDPSTMTPKDLAIVQLDGSVTKAEGSAVLFSNGAVVTPDGKTFIVAESFGSNLLAFDVADDGSLSNRRVWANLKEVFDKHWPGFTEPTWTIIPDGICLDAEGCVWLACPARDLTMQAEAPFVGGAIRVKEGGEVMQVLGMEAGYKGTPYAVMIDDDANLLLCMSSMPPHSPLGRDNSWIEKVKVSVGAAKSDLSKSYHAGYC